MKNTREKLLIVLFILLCNTVLHSQSKFHTEFKYAQRLYKHRQYDPSIKILDELVRNPDIEKEDFKEAYIYLAFSYRKINKFHLAEPALEELFKIDPGYNPDVDKFEKDLIAFFNEFKNESIGSVKITTFRDSAEVFLNNKFYGKTPLVIEHIFADEYEVAIIKGGYNIEREFINIFPQDTSLIKKRLVWNDFVAVTKVITDPPGAELYLDNLWKGNTPLFLDDFLADDYKMEIKKEGYKDIEVIRDFKAHKLNEIDIKLTKEKDYFIYSMIVPGLSQYLKGYKTHSLLFGLVSAGYMIYFKQNLPEKPSKYTNRLVVNSRPTSHRITRHSNSYLRYYYINDEEVTQAAYDEELLNKQENEREWDKYNEKKWRLIIQGFALYSLNLLDSYLVLRNSEKKEEETMLNIGFETSQDKFLLSLKLRF